MAKKQTRRTVSVSRAAYEAAKAKCEAEGITLSSIVEAHLRQLCGLPEYTASNPLTSKLLRRALEHDDAAIRARAAAVFAQARQSLPQHTELDAIAASRAAALSQADRDHQRAALDAAAERRREAEAEANPCRRNCGDDSLHPAGKCRPQRKPWTRQAVSP